MLNAELNPIRCIQSDKQLWDNRWEKEKRSYAVALKETMSTKWLSLKIVFYADTHPITESKNAGSNKYQNEQPKTGRQKKEANKTEHI